MAKKILSFFVLVVAMAVGLVTYSMTTSVSENQSAVINFVQKAKAETLSIVSPVLKKFGVDIEETSIKDANIVERQMENATDKLNEANKGIKSQ